MIIIPREKPVIEDLNSYYIDIERLFEHYQGEIGYGCIHFRSPVAEAAIFFDKDELLNGCYEDRQQQLSGKSTYDSIRQATQKQNFNINIYKIAEERVYFWANLPDAKKLYKDLSTEFTDLKGLIKKMAAEKLTGYIDVAIGNGKESALVFLNNGQIIGGSYSWGGGGLNRTAEAQIELVQRTKQHGGIFQVCRIPVRESAASDVTVVPNTEIKAVASILTVLEDLLNSFGQIFLAHKKSGHDYQTVLKKKFIEMADEYHFLDPFAAEFEYLGQKITYHGDSSDVELANGVIASIKALATDLKLTAQLVDVAAIWSEKYSRELSRIGVKF